MDSRVLAGLVAFAVLGGASPVESAAVDPVQAGYDAAVNLTRAKNFEQAEFAWLDFLRQYPNTPLDGNAEFFLGETYYARSDYRRAAAAYAAGIEKYPKGEMAPETLLKLGISLGRSGDRPGACNAFARLDSGFPNLTGVVHERGLVENRQYLCPGSARSAGTAGSPAPSAKPGTAIATAAPGADAPTLLSAASAPENAAPPKSAALEQTDGEPAPPAQPVIPVVSGKFPSLDAERAAARAELVVPPPPDVSKSGPHAAQSTPAVSRDTIKTAQNLLIALDYDVGPADGQAGPKLRDAVRSFETKNGMRSDGEVSNQLVQRLSAALAVRKKPAVPEPAASPVVASGTGFVVSRSGFVVTSYRLVDQCGEIRIRAPDSESATAPVVASDPHDDLALLRLKLPLEATVKFHEGRGPHEGDGVVVTGLSPSAAGASDLYVASGMISALGGARGDNRMLKLSTAPGTDRGGAPVFDRTGMVVGVFAGASPTHAANGGAKEGGIALRATVARNFLDAHDVDYESAAATDELKAAEIGERAKAAMVLVECHR